MRRREFIALVGGVAAVWPLAARAQQIERPRRISVVNVLAASDPETPPRVAAFETSLRGFGWTKDRNLLIDYYWGWDASTDTARAHAVARHVVETRPDVIVTVATPMTQVFQNQTTDTPIVAIIVADPVGTGLVRSLARPGGNITGFSNFEFSMGGKWVELLKSIAPHIKRVAMLFNPASAAGFGMYLQSVAAAASSLEVESIATPVRTTKDLEGALAALAREPNVGLIVAPDVFTSSNRDFIVSLATENHLPAVYPFRYFATAGGLFSYGIDTVDLWRRAPSYVDRILKGSKPADLPVQQPTKFELQSQDRQDSRSHGAAHITCARRRGD
jgi:putative ABC transport system substrate-binding protein